VRESLVQAATRFLIVSVATSRIVSVAACQRQWEMIQATRKILQVSEAREIICTRLGTLPRIEA
jgi:hypothetical protein